MYIFVTVSVCVISESLYFACMVCVFYVPVQSKLRLCCVSEYILQAEILKTMSHHVHYIIKLTRPSQFSHITMKNTGRPGNEANILQQTIDHDTLKH